MALEIKVSETVVVVDTIFQAMAEIEKILQEYIESSQETPLTITISKVKNNGPSVLGISINDQSLIKEAIR